MGANNTFLSRSNLVVFLLLFLPQLNAQMGPPVPCPDCEQAVTHPLPYEGSWFNPEQSGSGFLFDIQNNILLGYYFGYDEDGDTVWSLFSGELQDATGEGAMWKVQAQLQKFKDGACLNCNYTEPVQQDSLGEIVVTFNRLTHATFSVNGGNAQNIVPIYFGYSFAERPVGAPIDSFLVPELEGWWTVFIDENDMQPGPDAYSYTNFMVYVGKGRVRNGGAQEGALVFSTSYYPRPPELIGAGEILCQMQMINETNQPKCRYQLALLSMLFDINPANISSNRIYGENSNGDTIEMIRTSADFCPSTNYPENCVNTGIFE